MSAGALAYVVKPFDNSVFEGIKRKLAAIPQPRRQHPAPQAAAGKTDL